jgi:hypothetical protein
MHHANYSLFTSLDPVHEEPEVEAQVDPTEETNPEPSPSKASPGASNHHPCALFTFISFLWFLIVH